MQVFTLSIIINYYILINNLIYIISTYLYFNNILKDLYFNNTNLLNHLINKNIKLILNKKLILFNYYLNIKNIPLEISI